MEINSAENTLPLPVPASHKPYPTFWKSVLLLLSALPFGIIAALPLMPFFSLKSGIATNIIYLASMGGATYWGLHLRKNWQLKTGAVSFMVLLLALLAILSIDIILEPLMSMAPPSDMLMEMMKGMKNEPVAFFFAVVLAAPILEEVLFRSIILDGFLKNYKPLKAILLSAFLFGLMHGNLVQGIGAFVMGILLGWIYWKTESITLCILLHFANNLLAFISTLLTPDQYLDQSLRGAIGNDVYFSSLYVVSLVVALTSLLLLRKKLYPSVTGLTQSEQN
jgi:membrane protease YdiL (CAAX protease family)